MRWDDLEEMQEGRVVEVKAERRGGMGNKKKVSKGKKQSEEENSWVRGIGQDIQNMSGTNCTQK